MKIKSLQLKNIRSYVDEKIDFPSGNILFEGDIGSGKSTILSGIEFALFGLSADISGQSLLRMGEDSGETTLIFESEGKEYKVKRYLSKKAGSIKQDAGYIIVDAEKNDYSPEEMRSKVLQILKFNESLSSRSSSKIFRYAIFTPQEEIKEILNLKPSDRLQTLRKAFGVEDYKIAKENSQKVVRKLKSMIDVKSGLLQNIGELTESMRKNNEQKITLQTRILELAEQLGESRKSLETIEKQLEEIQSKKEEFASLQSQKTGLEQVRNSKSAQLGSLKLRIAQAEQVLKMLNKEMQSFLELKKPDHSRGEVQKQVSEFQRKLSELQTDGGKIVMKIENYNSLVSKGLCPTCEREIHSADFGSKIDTLKKELEEKQKSISEINAKIQGSENALKLIQEYELNNAKQESVKKQIADKNNTITFDSKDLEKVQAEFDESGNRLENIICLLNQYKDISTQFLQLDQQKRAANARLTLLISEHSSVSQKISDIDEKNLEIQKKIFDLENINLEREKLSEKMIWIRDVFSPALDSIEQQVLLSLNQEFDNKFRYWFSVLMENSEIKVSVDESFTPLVEQNSYSLDVSSLSGGEKTSVALAYRLALNNLVKSVCSSLDSNLLIMDEPTDGFSKEQLFKIKDVLDEINCEQTILVSHERELESFVDNIFRITKHDHISKIEKIS